MPCFVSNIQYPHIGTYHNPLYWLPWTHLLQVHLSTTILAKMNNFGIFMKSFAGLSISKYYISIKVFPLKCTFFDWSLILCEASFDIKFNSSLLKNHKKKKHGFLFHFSYFVYLAEKDSVGPSGENWYFHSFTESHYSENMVEHMGSF